MWNGRTGKSFGHGLATAEVRTTALLGRLVAASAQTASTAQTEEVNNAMSGE
jgi:hypothetical protein